MALAARAPRRHHRARRATGAGRGRRDPRRAAAARRRRDGRSTSRSFASVREFAPRFADAHDHLDVLVNNAGLVLDARRETVDGNETTFQVNHLGPFLLTKLLRDPLVAGDARPGRRTWRPTRTRARGEASTSTTCSRAAVPRASACTARPSSRTSCSPASSPAAGTARRHRQRRAPGVRRQRLRARRRQRRARRVVIPARSAVRAERGAGRADVGVRRVGARVDGRHRRVLGEVGARRRRAPPPRTTPPPPGSGRSASSWSA